MLRKLFTIALALIAAMLGVLAGRMVAQMRTRAAGAQVAPQPVNGRVHPRDVMPGLVAALRVRDRPWSYLHVPPWLAAFSVNFAFAALRSEVAPWMRALGISMGHEAEGEHEQPPARGEVWTAETAPPPEPPRSQPPAEGFRPFA